MINTDYQEYLNDLYDQDQERLEKKHYCHNRCIANIFKLNNGNYQMVITHNKNKLNMLTEVLNNITVTEVVTVITNNEYLNTNDITGIDEVILDKLDKLNY